MTDSAVTLISINEAIAQGIQRVRMPSWPSPCDHLRIDSSPLWQLYAPGKEYSDAAQYRSSSTDHDHRAWQAYTGPLPHSAEYHEEAAKSKLKRRRSRFVPLHTGPLAAMADEIRAYHRRAGIPLLTYIKPEQEPEYRCMPDFFAVETYARLVPAKGELGSIVEEGVTMERVFIERDDAHHAVTFPAVSSSWGTIDSVSFADVHGQIHVIDMRKKEQAGHEAHR